MLLRSLWKRPPRRHFALVVLAVFVVVGVAGSAVIYRTEEQAARASFEVNADEMIDRIRAHVDQRFALLESTVAFASVMGDRLDAPTLRQYIDLLRLEENYDGVRGVGFARVLRPDQAAQASVEILRNYGLEREIWPATRQKLLTPVILLEPQDERSGGALGYDMFSDPSRRQAMTEASAKGRLAVTAPVDLVREGPVDRQRGIIAYGPLPSKADKPAPSEMLGVDSFLFILFRAGDLHKAALGNSSRAAVEVETRDTTDGLDALLYRSENFDGGPAPPPFQVTQVLNMGGREWTITARPGPGYDGASHIFTLTFALVFAALAVASATATLWQIKGMEAADELHGVLARTVEEKDLLLQEMKHRIKNSIARILAMARQTGLSAGSIEEFNASFSARLQAMANAQEMLTRSHWRRAELRDLLRRELEQVFGALVPESALDGPVVTLEERAVQALGLTFHELATNSLKYGAAGAADGEVTIRWRVENDETGRRLELEWREIRTQVKFKDTRRGFGTRLIDINICSELGGTIDRVATDGGLSIRITVPLAAAD